MPSAGNRHSFRLYTITDRHSLPGGPAALEGFIRRAVAAGVDMIQIREKDLHDGDLLAMTKLAVSIARGGPTRILVNDRLDVALAAGAAGVHLGGHSAPPAAVREAAPEGFVIGVSTHNREEVERAEAGTADFITFGPVFFTPSKAHYGPPLGLEALSRTCAGTRLPVFPLGGIKSDNYSELLNYPVAGLAAISLFQAADDLDALVAGIRKDAEAGN